MPKYLDNDGLRNVWSDIENLNAWMPANAGAHNSIYRGKDITSQLNTGKVYSSIANGTFDDIFIGDYFIASIPNVNANIVDATIETTTDSYSTEHVFRVVKLGQDTNTKTNYAMILPDDILGTGPMHASSVAGIEFRDTDMNTQVLQEIQVQLGTIFQLVPISQPIDSNGNLGAEFAVDLLTAIEVYGCSIYGVNGFQDLGSIYGQLPAFALNSSLIPLSHTDLHWNWWLRSRTSSTEFGLVNADGLPSSDAMDAYKKGSCHSIRPAFYIGASNSSEKRRIVK